MRPTELTITEDELRAVYDKVDPDRGRQPKTATLNADVIRRLLRDFSKLYGIAGDAGFDIYLKGERDGS